MMEKIKFENLSGWLKLASIVGWIVAGGWGLVLLIWLAFLMVLFRI